MCADPNNAAVCIISVPFLIPSNFQVWSGIPDCSQCSYNLYWCFPYSSDFHCQVLVFLSLFYLLSYTQISWNCNIYNPGVLIVLCLSIQCQDVFLPSLYLFGCWSPRVFSPEEFQLLFPQMFIPVVRMRYIVDLAEPPVCPGGDFVFLVFCLSTLLTFPEDMHYCFLTFTTQPTFWIPTLFLY